MAKKIVCLFILFTFLVLNFSCYRISEKDIETITRWKGKKAAKVKVLSVIKKSGKKIQFRQDSTGRIVSGGIQGEWSAPSKRTEIKQSDIYRIYRNKNKSIYKIILKNGQIIEPIYAVDDNDRVIVYDSETIFIPFSEIQSVRVSYLDTTSTFVICAGLLASFLIRYINSE